MRLLLLSNEPILSTKLSKLPELGMHVKAGKPLRGKIRGQPPQIGQKGTVSGSAALLIKADRARGKKGDSLGCPHRSVKRGQPPEAVPFWKYPGGCPLRQKESPLP
jgi:hypothetical protein